MKSSRVLTASVVAALLLCPVASWAVQAVCSDVVGRTPQKLNVLTINLLFSEIADRQLRLTRIADEAKLRADSGNPIDVILLQEVVGGLLAGTANASADLRQLLAARGLDYNLRYRLANGIPFLLTVGNAILSRCAVDLTLFQFLPVVTEEPFPGLSFAIPLNRQVMMTRLDVPGIGKVNVYNTHLCANCDPQTERMQQAAVLLQFVAVVESFFPGQKRIVLGGDFNTNLNFSQDQLVYAAVGSQGFVDSYRAAQNYQCLSCCDPANAGEGIAGCTYAVAGNPYANHPPFAVGPMSRIDYIFLRNSSGVPFHVLTSGVIFPPPPATFVSDHSAVLTEVALQ